MPLPDGPTTASSGALASRATSSSTSRSRPKKNSASSASNGASPLNGQTSARRAAARRASGAAAQVQRRVLHEDRPLELLQLDARLEPELVVEQRPRPPVHLEALRLPAAPVEREHQLRPEPLAERVLGGERLELGDEREVAAERELGVDALLDGGEPQLLEPLDLDARERLELEVGERASVPERLRGAERLGRRAGIAGRERLAARRRRAARSCSRSSSPGSTRSR